MIKLVQAKSQSQYSRRFPLITSRSDKPSFKIDVLSISLPIMRGRGLMRHNHPQIVNHLDGTTLPMPYL